MAERNAKVKLGVVPDGDPAKPLKAIAEASKTAKKEYDRLKESVKGMGVPAKDAATKLSDMFLATKKSAQDSAKKIDELAASIKRLGLTTRDVTGMARAMGREFQLSTQQINQALRQSGQGAMARRGGMGGMGGMFGRGMRGMGGTLMAGFGIEAITAGLARMTDTAVDAEVMEGARLDRPPDTFGSWTYATSDFLASLPIFSHVAHAMSGDARAEAARSSRRLERARDSVVRRSRETAEMAIGYREEDDAARMIRERQEGYRLRRKVGGADVFARESALAFLATGQGFNFLANEETTGGMATLGIQRQEFVNQSARGVHLQRFREAEGRTNLAASTDFDMDGRPMGSRDRADLIRVRERIVGGLEEQLQTIQNIRNADIQTAQNAMQQARLMNQLTRARQQQLEGAAIQFGSMTHEQQGDVMTAAQTFRREGIGGLTPEQLQQLRGTGLFNQQLDEQAFARARNGAFDQLANLAGRNPADELRRTLAESRVQAEVTIAFDEARIARALEVAMRQFDARVEQIATRLDAARDRAREAARLPVLPPG